MDGYTDVQMEDYTRVFGHLGTGALGKSSVIECSDHAERGRVRALLSLLSDSEMEEQQ